MANYFDAYGLNDGPAPSSGQATTATITPGNSTDYAFLVTPDGFSSLPSGWSTPVESVGVLVAQQLSSTSPLTVTYDQNGGSAYPFANVIATVPTNGSVSGLQANIEDFAVDAQTCSVTISVTAGQAVIVNWGALIQILGSEPDVYTIAISDSQGNLYSGYQATYNGGGGDNFSAFAALYVATASTSGTLTITGTLNSAVLYGNSAGYLQATTFTGLQLTHSGIVAELQIDSFPAASTSGNSFVRFRLRLPPTEGVTVPQANGNIITITGTTAIGSISQNLWANNAVNVPGSFYTIEVWSNGRITSSIDAYLNANVDLSEVTAISKTV